MEGVTYDGASNWGLAFLIVLLAVAALYVGGGVGFAHKTQGSDLVIRSHPHFAHWTQLQGLVTDGAVYAKARVDEHRGVGGGALVENLVDGDGNGGTRELDAQEGTKPEEDAEEAVDDEDGLVE
eukprot:COSAG02_NODE_1773_length_10980_cov_8.196765_3_plen_124_part_00